MNSFPLKKGQTYKQLPNGEMVAVDAESINVDEIPQAVSNTVSEPLSKSDTSSEFSSTVESQESEQEKATKILNDIQSKMEAAAQKLKDVEPVKPIITDEDKYNFLQAIISNKAFKKEYSLLNGKLKVVFKTITTAEAEAVSEAVVIQSERVPYSTMISMGAAHMKYSMSCAIAELASETDEGIKIKRFESPLTKYSDEPRKDTYYVRDNNQLKSKTGMLEASPGQKVIWASTESFSDIQIPIYNMLFGCFQKFDALLAELVKESSNPDFFLIGADGP